GAPESPPASLGTRLLRLGRTPVALADPSVEDITARVLRALGAHGWTAAAPPVRAAVAFLRRQQCPGGAWWGRWQATYRPGTGGVLRGLAAVGEDLRAPWVRRAVRWLLERQTPDGGWGEDVASYRDPARAGVGPSLAPITAPVVLALLDAGEAESA